MKKILSYILISLIVGVNLLAPFSVGIGEGNKIQIQKNETEASGSIKVITSPEKTNTTISGNVRVIFESGDFSISKAAAIVYLLDNNNVALFVQNIELKDAVRDNTDMEKNAYAVRTGNFNFPNLNSNTTYVLKTVASQTTPLWASTVATAAGAVVGGVVAGVFTLNPIGMAAGMAIGAELADPSTESNETSIGESPAITTNDNNNKQTVTLDKSVNVNQNYLDSILPECSLGILPGTKMNIGGCIGGILYWGIFKPTSVLFALSGILFDKTFAYSVQDSSYKSAFVVQGWGLIRDLCNMLFIFIMLYVAIGTILSLHSMKTKETIVNIVIIGLFINFSLFATQVIIDASNITARVFYNSDAIKVGPKINGVIQNTPGSTGEIKLSEALISKINPQSLIINATEIGNLSVKGNVGSDGIQKNGISASTFILVILLASGINIVGFIVFLTVGFLFITRVIGLWMAMILAPLAFFTYILPSMAKTKMIGWEHWWEDTLKLAFLAPVFIFFLYIIIKFLDSGLGILYTESTTGLDFVLRTAIPFVFIMIFLIRAKKIAVDMSGEFGEMAVKAGSAIGGMVLGGAVGAGAYAMRGTIGALGDKVANSDWAKTHGRWGNMAADVGKWTASKSFDARKTAFGTMAGKEMGVDMAAKGIGMDAKEGGYAKHKAEITEKRRARAESHKLGNNSEQVQALHKAEEGLSKLKNTIKNDTDRVDGTLEAKRKVENSLNQRLQEANRKLTKDPTNALLIADAEEAQKEFDSNAKIIADNAQERAELNSATGRHADKTADGKVNEVAYNKIVADVQTTKDDLAKIITDGKERIKKATEDIQKTVDEDVKNAENELKTAKENLAAKEKIVGPNPSQKENAILQEMKNAVSVAENKIINVKNSGAQEISKAEASVKKINDALTAKAGDKALAAEELEKKMTKKKNEVGFSKTTTIINREGKPENVAHSIDGLGLTIIPKLHHHVEETNAERINDYAEEIRGRFFNKEANDIAAHEAIMRSEIKKH